VKIRFIVSSSPDISGSTAIQPTRVILIHAEVRGGAGVRDVRSALHRAVDMHFNDALPLAELGSMSEVES
jgi:hypothetical protein